MVGTQGAVVDLVHAREHREDDLSDSVCINYLRAAYIQYL
jgi:hypothetical protein